MTNLDRRILNFRGGQSSRKDDERHGFGVRMKLR